MKTKILIILLLAILPLRLIAQPVLTAKFTSNGIAPIPAFTLGEPAGILNLNCNLAKNFEVSPLVGFSLRDGKVWFTDFWWRYNVVMLRGKLIATAGFNSPSNVGEKININGTEIHQITRCMNLQSKLRYTINENNSLVIDYWYILVLRNKVNDTGHYLSLIYDWKNNTSGKIQFGANVSTFYLVYYGEKPSNGFASSIETVARHKKTGLFVGAQAFVPLTLQANFSWNLSVGIKRNLF